MAWHYSWYLFRLRPPVSSSRFFPYIPGNPYVRTSFSGPCRCVWGFAYPRLRFKPMQLAVYRHCIRMWSHFENSRCPSLLLRSFLIGTFFRSRIFKISCIKQLAASGHFLMKPRASPKRRKKTVPFRAAGSR